MYLKIFSAWAFLFVYKRIKIIVGLFIVMIIAYFSLLDSSQTYYNIANNDYGIKKVLKNKYKNDNGYFFMDLSNENKKILHFYVSEDLNQQFQFAHLKKYKLFYIQDKKTKNEIFEIELFNKNKKTMIKNIYNSYLNNSESWRELNKENETSYISYFTNNNSKNILFTDFFYELLTVMTNEKSFNDISDLLNSISQKTTCQKHEILLNVSSDQTRISVLCK
jgi:hypothetical protein